ncbi:MAG TPA: efflux RND transporter periplasmic adaptor subunit [Phycisphaerae bacterium]|nr:efflux RND transporter periplasmic adaptor subunit [Phycisphaerae bacterium]
MRTWLIVAAVVVVIGGSALFISTTGGGGDFEISVATVETGPLTMTIETSGTVEPLSTVEVGCEVTGKIIELPVDNDQPVKKGQVICRIDPQLSQAENDQANADFERAKGALADAKIARNEQIANLPVMTRQALSEKEAAEAALVSAEFNNNRVENLAKSGDAPEAELVAAKSTYLRAKSAVTASTAAYDRARNNEKLLVQRAEQVVAQAEATLNQAKARLDFTTTRVERCTIVSPIDGIVLRRYLDEGQTVTAAFQTPLLFLLAPSLDRMKVSAKISESDISHIEIGQPARFTIEAKRPVKFEGKILHKRNQPDVIQNVVTYTVLFEVDNDAKRTLVPGLSVNVEIECVAKKNVPQIANAALRFKPPLSLEERQDLLGDVEWPPQPTTDAEGNPADYCSKASVWGFDTKSKTWRFVPIWVGITDNVSTEILSGPKPGESFVKRFIDNSSSSFGLKEAIKMARPDNRTL